MQTTVVRHFDAEGNIVATPSNVMTGGVTASEGNVVLTGQGGAGGRNAEFLMASPPPGAVIIEGGDHVVPVRSPSPPGLSSEPQSQAASPAPPSPRMRSPRARGASPPFMAFGGRGFTIDASSKESAGDGNASVDASSKDSVAALNKFINASLNEDGAAAAASIAVESDNTNANMLVDAAGRKLVKTVLHEVGSPL